MKGNVRSAWVVARLTFLEVMRHRFLLLALLIVAVLAWISVAAASVSFGQEGRIIVDVGLAAGSALGRVVAVGLTVIVMSSELRHDSLYIVLLRPIARWAYILGRFVGLWGALVCAVTLMISATAGIVFLYAGNVPQTLWQCMWLNYIEIAVVIALALLFSTFSVSVFAALYAAGAVIAGSFSGYLLDSSIRAAQRGDVLSSYFGKLAYYILPDLQGLSLRLHAANDLAAPPGFVTYATLYGCAYATVIVLLAMLIFCSKRSV